MKAFFFGESSTRLYGVYHPPKAGVGGASSVLICCPNGHEYIYTHRALRQLAGLLSRDGYHVLRFDYFATGDSRGATEDGTAERWMADIRTAVRELRDLSGRHRLSLVGLRLGGLLAACAEISSIQDLILWDPVVQGRDYLIQLRQSHQRALAHSKLRPPAATASITGIGEQLLGFPYSPELRRDIERLDLHAVEHFPQRLVLVGCEGDAAHQRLRRHLAGTPANFEYHAMPEAFRWYAAVEERPIVHPPGTLELLVNTLVSTGQ